MAEQDFEAQHNPSEGSFKQPDKRESFQAASLTHASQKLIADILKFLYIAYVNIPIYPAGSDMVVKPIESLYEKLADIFTRDPQVIFSNVKNILIVNGERLKEGSVKKSFEDNFLKFFDDLRLESICFKKGLTSSELSAFLYFLSQGIKKGEDFKALFQKENIEHVVLNEVNYRVVSGVQGGGGGSHSTEDLIVLDYIVSKVLASGQGGNTLDNLERNSKEVADALSKLSEDINVGKAEDDAGRAEVVLKLLQKLGNQLIDQDPTNWQKCKAGLARTLLNLQPELRGKIIFGAKSEKDKNLVEGLIPELSDEEIIGIFMQAYKAQETSLEQMRSTAKSLIEQKGQNSKFVSALQEKLTECGVPLEKAKWVATAGKFGELPLEEKVAMISRSSLEDYWLFRSEIEWPVLISEISQQNRIDFFETILEQQKKYYTASSAQQKSGLCQDCSALMKAGCSIGGLYTLKALKFGAEIFLEEGTSETDPILSGGLIEALGKLFEQKNFEAVIKVCDLFKAHPGLSAVQSEKIAKIRKDAFSNERLKEVIELYIQEAEKNVRDPGFADLMLAVGKPAIEMLIEAAMADEAVVKSLGYFNAFLRRRIIGEILAGLIKSGEGQTIAQLLEQNMKSRQESIVKNAVELLADIRCEEIVHLLEYPLGHLDKKIRIKAVFALGKIGGKQSISFLNAAVQENIDEVRLDIISVLGRIGDSKSLVILRNLQDEENQAEIVKAVHLIESRLKNPEHKE